MFTMMSRQARLTTAVVAVVATLAEGALLATLAEPATPTVRLERVVVRGAVSQLLSNATADQCPEMVATATC